MGKACIAYGRKAEFFRGPGYVGMDGRRGESGIFHNAASLLRMEKYCNGLCFIKNNREYEK